MIKAVLFDLGSTLWDDTPSTRVYWKYARRALRTHGMAVKRSDFERQVKLAIANYCPSLTRAIIWHFTKGDFRLYRDVVTESVTCLLEKLSNRHEFLRLNPLFDGVHDLLLQLGSKFRLAVASQNFSMAESWLEYHNLSSYFSHVSLSERERLYKPDPRFYLSACKALRVNPREAVMVGDRLDNDIWPANRLSMVSVRVLTGLYSAQRPRYHSDLPDYTISQVSELLDKLDWDAMCLGNPGSQA